ncbi:MAG: HAMP domain-containing sensor histidine kinase, partial [Candidatus Bathyarchaeota archaeon]
MNLIGAQRFGVNREEEIGRSLFTLQPDLKESERYREYIEIMETGIPNVFDVYDHYSGIEFLRINAFKVGEGLGLIASDLTELRNEQEARARLDQELFEQKILADQLVEMDRMKTNLMNTAAHEIRTPITAIKGYAELMEGIIIEEKNPALIQYLEVITRNINRLEHLSNDLLDMQRIESKRMIIEKEKIGISSLMDAISQEMRLLLEERNQTLEINISTDEKIIFCNEMRMIQVLINLVS